MYGKDRHVRIAEELQSKEIDNVIEDQYCH